MRLASFLKKGFSYMMFLVTVLPIALKNMMRALTSRLEFRLEAYAWTGDDDGNQVTELKAYWLIVCIPAATGKKCYFWISSFI